MTHSNWTIRPAEGQDIPFIYSSWLNSYRYDSSLGRGCRNQVFFPEYNRVIDRILSRENVKTIVACKTDEPGVIFGYLVFQPGILHYCFVKEVFRKEGVASSLALSASPAIQFTHRTTALEPILKKHPELIFNPFILFKQKPKEPQHGETRTTERTDPIDNHIIRTGNGNT